MNINQNLVKTNARFDLFKVVALLAIVTWIANFWYFRDLGLYLDDYGFTGYSIGVSSSQFISIIKQTFSSFYLGRPVGFFILYLLSFISGKLFGLTSLYIFSYLLILTNNILYYFFLKRLWIQPIFCICGTLAYTLFPADNSRTWLTSIQILPAFTFLLIAFLCYFSDKKFLSYLSITASLLCYETVFPLFIIAPLFKYSWTKQINKKIFIHPLICGSIFLFSIIIRKIVGDSRISNLDLISTLKISFHQILFGPIVSLYMFVYRIFSLRVTNEIIFLMIIAFVCLIFAFTDLKISKIKTTDNLFILKKLTLLGFALLLLAYPLTLTVDASVISGDGSRVHNAAAFGASILLGLICYLFLTFLKNYRLKQLAFIIIAAYFSLLVGFGLTVQNDNRLSWQYQQAFWSDVIKLAPDLSEKTVVFIDSPSLRGIWGAQLSPFPEYCQVLPILYSFPEKWKVLPSMYRLDDHWGKKITANGKLKLAKEDGLIYHGSLWYSGLLRIVNTYVQDKN